jgi:hypothetical protein
MPTDLTLKEIDAVERLCTETIKQKIRHFASEGVSSRQIALSLSHRAQCSIRVAQHVVWDALDEWMQEGAWPESLGLLIESD